MSLWIGLDMASLNDALLITAASGYGPGLDLLNSLQLVEALGTRNSTILPISGLRIQRQGNILLRR